MLFSAFFCNMLCKAKEDLTDGICICLRQTAVSSTFGVCSHEQKPPGNASLTCYLLTTAPVLAHMEEA